MRTFLERVFDDKTGPTAIAVVTIAGLTTLGTTLNSRYNANATDVGS